MVTQVKNLRPLLNPASVAFVGASEKPGAGSFVIDNLRRLGYRGRIIPVNPRYSDVFGLPSYASLKDVPSDVPIDCVAILLGHEHVPLILEEAAERRIHAAWAFASGFAETGEDGVKRQKRLREICLAHEILFCGPNCVGYVNLLDRVGTFSAPLSPTLRKGGIAVVAQSGSVILALANSNRGLGFSTLVSSGNEAVLDAVDYMEHFVEDPRTKVIAAFIEGFRRPAAFVRVCEKAFETGKPIIMVKVGRSELARRTVVTHTGALAGSDDVQDALFRKLGVIRVDDLDQLMETAEAFAHLGNRLPRGNRVGAITVSGGEIGLMGDLARGLSLTFPELSEASKEELKRRLPPYSAIGNPLDAWGSGDLAATYPACLEALAREERIDVLAVSQDAPPGMADSQVKQYAEVARAAAQAASGTKPVLAFSHVSGGLDSTIRGILEQGNVPFLQGTRESLVAIHHLVRYGESRRARNARGEVVAGSSPPSLEKILQEMDGPKRVLPYGRSMAILSAYGIKGVKEGLAQSLDEATRAAESLGYPVALKVLSPQIPHKSDAGLVELNVKGPAELREGYGRLQERVRQSSPHAAVEGILVQEMVPAGATEVLVGVFGDPSFGPALVLGTGGVLVELFQDRCIRIPPVTTLEAEDMVASLKGRALLEGYRGRAASDTESLIRTLVQVGRMAHDLRDRLISLDLNPLMVLPGRGGVRAVDVVMEAGQE
jgi:acyl-CoA synthetase (NDP forming)